MTFLGDLEAVAYANVFLRTTERILIKVGKIHAETFDELFEGTKALPWEDFIPEDGKFWVAKANSIKSKLFSPSDIQSIMKKAMVERLKTVYHRERFEETGAEYPIRVSILKDEVLIGLDTSGVSLHKRGYRQMTAPAPITETLASALILFTPWKKDRILVDPFCGSGTFPIEAAMLAANMAPGMKRHFLAEKWENLIPIRHFQDAEEGSSRSCGFVSGDRYSWLRHRRRDHQGAGPTLKMAGVDHLIHFQQRPVSELSHPKKYGFVITNPPYGERLEEKKNLPALYKEMGDAFRRLDSWSEYVITAYEDAEKHIRKKSGQEPQDL